MEAQVRENFIQCEFRYCVVNWEIENFGFAAHRMKYELESPPFHVQPFTTLWKFLLKSDQGLCDDAEMIFCLERMDSQYETVWVSFNVSLIDQNKKEWRGARGEHHFGPNDKRYWSVPNIYYEKVNLNVPNFNFVTIRCQMIVAYDEKYSFSDQSIDSGLKRLSKDMDKLYKSKEYADMTIKLDDNVEIAAHRAILSARNNCIKGNLIEGNTPVLNYSSLRLDGMKQVLRYIYTGDIVKALDNPSVSVHDYINYLSIDELKIHFKASEIKLKSSIAVHQTGCTWRIENFMDRNERCIVSDLISCNMLNMVWKLFLYPKGVDGDGEHLAVIAEKVEGKIEGNVWAEVEIYTDPFCRTWKSMKEIKQGEVFEILNLDDRKVALEKLEEGTLGIGFRACVSVGVTHSPVDQRMNIIQRTSLEDYYKKLSRDIFQLRNDEKYSDLTIIAQNETFKAHKCILSVRCLEFLKELRDTDKPINIVNIRPEIVNIILDYMYSGVIGNSDCPVIIEVYEAAKKLGAKHILRECSKYLRQNINTDNVVKILTIAYKSDYELEWEALKFARNNCLRRQQHL